VAVSILHLISTGYLAGSMAAFMISTWEEKKNKIE
jgi:hypothetical protein